MTPKSVRKRLDALLVDRGLADSLARARAMILAGEVRVNGERVDKAGTSLAPNAQLAIVTRVQKYASRGGIKLALVEACINAAEHSLSPDRKIYQRFRVENDKLVVIVASRGVMPANVSAQNGYGNGKSRRGWGLKLIQSLMDEVEFERVDDGTQLRMTKYIRK